MSKKQHVSVRLAEADHRKIKEIARRLGVKESDLFRYIVKNSLNKLLPLQDELIRGTDLIPVLLDCGQDLARYFDLDTEQLDQIVNGGLADEGRRIERQDLDILAMAGSSNHYARLKLAAITHESPGDEDIVKALKYYLSQKYQSTCSLLSLWARESIEGPQSAISPNNTHTRENQYA